MTKQKKPKEAKTPPTATSEKEKFWSNMNKWLEKEMKDREVSPGVLALPTAQVENYESLPDEAKKGVDAIMDELEPDINKKAIDLLRSEIRDKIARSGDVSKLQEYMKKGQKPSIKRKKGCLFLQFGSGEPNDEIHEFLVAST